MGASLDWLRQGSVWSGPDGIPTRLLEHVWYSGLAVLIAVLIALPVGMLIGHTGRGNVVAATVSNVWRALPTFGLVILVFRLAPLSIWPVLAALVVIAVPPILLNTDTGIRSIDPEVRDAARAVGMTGWQALRRVELPLAMPLIVAGVRSAAGQVIATATVAAFVGLGGLGRFIIDGYAVRDLGEITAGALAVAALALMVEGAFALVLRVLGSRRAPRPRPIQAARRLEETAA
jgi:osmoprotectant transport system permease protein